MLRTLTASLYGKISFVEECIVKSELESLGRWISHMSVFTRKGYLWNTSFPEYQTANQIQGYTLARWNLKNAVDFSFINNNNNIKSQTNSKHTFSHSENFYNLPERSMTLSKVLKKLPNFIKHY